MPKIVFKEGDYVRFLNEKQEGVVQEVISEQRILVAIEDGFPIEVTPAELVLVTSKATTTKDSLVKVPVPSKRGTYDFKILTDILPIKNEIYLAIVPSESQIMTGPVSIYLINSSDYNFVYTLHVLNNNQTKGFHFGSILQMESIFIREVKRGDFFESGELLADFLIYDYHEHQQISRIHKKLQLSIPDISQTYPQLQSPVCFTRTFTIFKTNTSQVEEDKFILEKLKSEFANNNIKKSEIETEKKKNKYNPPLSEYGLSPAKYEVDLHIEELVGNLENINTTEILRIQLDHFRKELDKAILHHSKSIVFIHGIGNGKLRTEIRKELNALSLKFIDAPYNRYGAGATEVYL